MNKCPVKNKKHTSKDFVNTGEIARCKYCGYRVKSKNEYFENGELPAVFKANGFNEYNALSTLSNDLHS